MVERHRKEHLCPEDAEKLQATASPLTLEAPSINVQ